jgi:flagellin-specific chaperone FliS
MQSYELYISDFKTAYRAMKNGDMTKYQTVIQRAQELKTKSDKLAGELNPEEEQRFANFLNKKANELAQFASQNH